MELNSYEVSALEEIRKWEKEGHEGLGKKILDVVSKPVDYLVSKVSPDMLKMVESAMEGTIKQMVNVSSYSLDPEKLLRRAHENGVMIKDLSELRSCDLDLLDSCNRKHINFHEKASATQGAVAGIGGALAATADMSAVLVQDFHVIQEIAFSYGYDPNGIIEKQIILSILKAALGSSEMKLDALRDIELLKESQSEGGEADTSMEGVRFIGAKDLGEYIEDLAVALLARLTPRTLPIPIVTMAISAHSNHEIIEQSGKAAFMAYRKRFIERKRGL